MDNETLYKKLCSIEELLQMVFRTQEWNAIGDSHPEEKQWVIVVGPVHEHPVEAQYTDGKFYYGDYLTFVMPDDYCDYWLPMERSRQTHTVASQTDINPIEYTYIDKSQWPDGPWQTEPDRVVWYDVETDLPCIINRHRQGFWLGYVGISSGHKLYGIHADDASLHVHNGVDFSGIPLTNLANQDGLGHLRDWYWFGFSCNWDPDLIPVLKGLVGDDYEMGQVYRGIEYVKSECRKLAAQLGAIK